MTKHVPAKRIAREAGSVWIEMISLCEAVCPEVNLGHGFPDFLPPKFITDALAQAVTSGDVMVNQYTRMLGHPRLITVLSQMYSKLLDREIDPVRELVITQGGYNALFCAIMGIIDPGDEVIILEPFYEAFDVFVRQAGGIPVFIPLIPMKSGSSMTASDWTLDMSVLENSVTCKTKMMIVNNPLNPLGKVFKRSELEEISAFAIKHDLLILADEVYEFLVFDDQQHIRMATLPGMWERTITAGSSGKAFSVTGWKTGWVYGPAALMKGVQLIFLDTIRVVATPMQEAIAVGFEREVPLMNTPESFWTNLNQFLGNARTQLVEVMENVGFRATIPQGGYFMVADYTEIVKFITNNEIGSHKDVRFVKWFTKNMKLHTMPLTAFYSKEHKHLGENFVRLCFSKKPETMDKVKELLSNFQNIAK